MPERGIRAGSLSLPGCSTTTSRTPLQSPGGEAGQIEERLLKELRPDGLVSLEGDSLWHLEHRTQGESLAIPVSFKKDGALSARSKALSGERFRTLGAFARAKAGELHSRIASGEAKAEPYRYGDRTGCDFCGYRHICGFDSSLPGYGYRDITRTGQEEALLRIQAYRGTAGSAGAEEDETGPAMIQRKEDRRDSHGRKVDKRAAERH